MSKILSKFIESIKKPIVLFYNIYLFWIYQKYNNEILYSISKSNSSYDKINMILYISVFILSIFLLDNKSDRLGFKLFFNNNIFCVINLMWLLYIISIILKFGLIESLSAIKEKSFSFSIFDFLYNSTLYILFQGWFLIYKAFTLAISAGNFYIQDKKLESLIHFLDNHFKEKNLDYIYQYVIILGLNIFFLFIVIFINIIYNIVHKIHKNINEISKDKNLKEKKH